MSTAGVDVERAVLAFLYREARLADDANYAGWLELWAAGEVLYWVVPHADLDPSQEVSYVYDDRGRLKQRVARWDSGFAWAQVPRSETNRIVGNVEILEAEAGVVTVLANVHIVVTRRGRTSFVTERVTYRLREAADSYVMAEKKVVLLGGEEPVGNITFVL